MATMLQYIICPQNVMLRNPNLVKLKMQQLLLLQLCLKEIRFKPRTWREIMIQISSFFFVTKNHSSTSNSHFDLIIFFSRASITNNNNNSNNRQPILEEFQSNGSFSLIFQYISSSHENYSSDNPKNL